MYAFENVSPNVFFRMRLFKTQYVEKIKTF